MEEHLSEILVLSMRLNKLVTETSKIVTDAKNILEVENDKNIHSKVLKNLQNSIDALDVDVLTKEKLELVLNSYNTIIENVRYWRINKISSNITIEQTKELLSILFEIKDKFEKISEKTTVTIVKRNLNKLSSIIDIELSKIQSNNIT
jgi:hypothetical protein